MAGSFRWLAKTRLSAFLLAAALALGGLAPNRQHHTGQIGPTDQFSLTNGAVIRLPSAWAPLPVTHIPPPAPLAPSAPPLRFADFLSFQNAADHSELEFALSNNPFLGHDSYWLDTEMHEPREGMVNYLFFFFFPPPYACLDGASAQYEHAESEAAGNNAPPTDVTINLTCQYTPSLPAFYSYFISPRVTFSRVSGTEHREGALRHLFLLPMDQREFNGVTFFIFEAQGTQELTLETLDHFNLPDSLQGMQPDFLWAVGAPSPFPFSHLTSRKNIPLVNVAYAGVAYGAARKPDFLRILRTVRVPTD
jgi:hypothetical protein